MRAGSEIPRGRVPVSAWSRLRSTWQGLRCVGIHQDGCVRPTRQFSGSLSPKAAQSPPVGCQLGVGIGKPLLLEVIIHATARIEGWTVFYVGVRPVGNVLPKRKR